MSRRLIVASVVVLAVGSGCMMLAAGPYLLDDYGSEMDNEVQGIRDAYRNHRSDVLDMGDVDDILVEEERFYDQVRERVAKMHHIAEDADHCQDADGRYWRDDGSHDDIDGMEEFLRGHRRDALEAETAEDAHDVERRDDDEFEGRADDCGADADDMHQYSNDYSCSGHTGGYDGDDDGSMH